MARRAISSLFARQLGAIRQLDLAQVDLVDGCRSMIEWVSSRLDVSPSTARDLVLVAKAADFEVEALLANGEVGWERAVAMVRLRLAGATDDVISQSFGLDLAGIARLTAALKRIDSKTEAGRFESRYLVVQKSWDESTLRYWGEAVGVDAETIEKALWARSDLLPDLPGVDRTQKLADAMSSICLDSLTGSSEALICWYHHHVAIHQLGLTFDPTSPPHRRRFTRRTQTTGPP